jgi:anti-sigma regulatory factor (Ser/Thr protein kinase)
VAPARAHHDVALALPAEPAAAGDARRLLVREGLDPDRDHVTCLLVSEIVTNAIRHAGTPGGPIVLRASLTDERAHIEVRDLGPGFDPAIRRDAPGFGLRMLDALASRWGVEHDASGTRVWFDVDRGPSAARPRLVSVRRSRSPSSPR